MLCVLLSSALAGVSVSSSSTHGLSGSEDSSGADDQLMLLELKNVHNIGDSVDIGMDRGGIDSFGEASQGKLLNAQVRTKETERRHTLEGESLRTSTSASSVPPPAFAVFSLSGFPDADNADTREFANDRFTNRLVAAKQSWAKDIENYIVVGHQSPIADVTLTGQGCTEGDTVEAPGSGHVFVEWNCPHFTYLLVTCRVLKWYASGCKYDRAMEYMMYVDPARFEDVKWVGIGDDDVGYAQDLLLDYLGHYDPKDRLVLNPAAESLENQRSGEGVTNFKWNPTVKQCNNLIPERCIGVVVSRGLFDAAKAEFQMESMEGLSDTFDGAHDTVQGLLWWMYDAKWIPMALRYHGNEEFDESRVPKVPQLLIAHKLTTPEAYEKYGAITGGYFPEPEALNGNSYKDSRHASGMDGGGSSLTPETCLPA